MTDNTTEQIKKMAVENKIIQLDNNEGFNFTDSFCNILNSNLKHYTPIDAIVNSFNSFCYEKSNNEKSLLTIFLCETLAQQENNTPLGEYLKNFMAHIKANNYTPSDLRTIDDIVSQVRMEKDGV